MFFNKLVSCLNLHLFYIVDGLALALNSSGLFTNVGTRKDCDQNGKRVFKQSPKKIFQIHLLRP